MRHARRCSRRGRSCVTHVKQHTPATSWDISQNLLSPERLWWPWQVYVQLKGLLDVEAELRKIDSKMASLDQQIASLQKKMSADSYLERVPQKVQDANIEKRSKQDEERSALESARARMTALI